MNKTILIVDDDRSQRRLIAGVLRGSFEMSHLESENGKDALRILEHDKEGDIALVVLDLEMPVMNGMDVLAVMKKKQFSVPVIVLTGNADTRMAVEAMRMGATDFLSKPVEGARLDVSVRNALRMSRMSHEIARLKRRVHDAGQFSDLIGHDKGMRESIVIGRKAAACDLPVLITGETGTGKEVFARAMHGESRRAGKSFIAVNCGALPEKLVESTLFGHEKGAFTGAVAKAPGKFLEASGGTIFLDEIGDLPLEAQVKLLRVLQQKEVESVGGAHPVSVDVRVVSATNRDLKVEVQEGRFREDLYFRLNVLHVDLPPLRQRAEDISFLAYHFMEQFCSSHDVVPKDITQSAMQKLQQHSWPGNVRELENVVNRTMALCEESILKPEHFSFLYGVLPDAASLSFVPGEVIVPLHEDGRFKTLRELEDEIVTLALAHHDQNMSLTARVLGIAKSTLYTKIGHLADRKSA